MYFDTATQAATVRSSGPKLHATPALLSELEGPGFKFVLNHKDHRFTVSFQRKGSKSAHWLDEYAQWSFSRSFDQTNVADWVAKLKQCHQWGWTKWALATDIAGFHPDGFVPQEPGLILDSFVEKLRPVIEGLPDKTQYTRKS